MIAFPFGFNTLKFISRKARPCNERSRINGSFERIGTSVGNNSVIV